MGAPTNVYVDPSIAANSGTGTSGDPYGDMQYALDTVTRDTTNGDRLNIKAGTDEILTAGLALTTYGTPTPAAPLILQGYTTVAEDGGKGGIDGNNGAYSLFASTALDYIHHIDLRVHNFGSHGIYLDNYCTLINCEIDDCSGFGIIFGAQGFVLGCYIHDTTDAGIRLDDGSAIQNYIDSKIGPREMGTCIRQQGTGLMLAYRNICVMDGATDGITGNRGAIILQNSIFSNGGTGQGIRQNSSSQFLNMIANNLIEGFSGTGGIGIDWQTGTSVTYFDGNAVQNCATDYAAITDKIIYGETDNESLGASPFTAAGTGDFSPVNTGNVKEGALPPDFGDGQ